jgi:predicted dehydrogenase
MDPIRIGMITCDLHGYYYAGLLGGYDPLELRDDTVGRGHAAYFFFYLHYNDPRRITVPPVPGFRITRFWDPEPAQAANAARIFNQEAVVCDRLEQVSDDVDLVFIPDCNGDGSNHVQLATPGLEKGVPTFVDKPFAFEYRDARRLVELARATHTPLLSASMLSHTPDTLQFRSRLAELGEPEFGLVKGGGSTMAGHIHAICFAEALFGNGVEAVEAMGQAQLAFVHLDYGGKPGRPKCGVVLNCDVGATYHCAMYASAYSSLGAIHSPPVGDFVFPFGARRILELLRVMVQTRQPQIPYEDMLEWIAVATAARLAQNERRRVALREVVSAG